MKPIRGTCYFLFFILLSFNAAGQPGSLDVTFGNDGKVIIYDDWAWTTAHTCKMQTDGKILVGGQSYYGTLSFGWTLYRYLDNGQSDFPFGNEGCVCQGFVGSAGVLGIALQSNQKIVELGFWGIESVIKRLNTDGTPDMSFGSNGEVLTNDLWNTMEIFQNDKIILIGRAFEDQSLKPSIGCLDLYGNLDQSFGESGICIISDTLIKELYHSTLQYDDKILVLGENNNSNEFVIARINANGIIDSTFGLDGIFNYEFSSVEIQPLDMITDPDDNILIAGNITSVNDLHPFLMRLTPSGLLDSSFNQTGFITDSYGDLLESWSTIAVQKDKKIVVGGISGDSLLLCSFLDDGSIDIAFGNSGFIKDFFGGDRAYIDEICVQDDGKLVAVGASDGDHMVLRYNTAVSIGLDVPETEIFSFNIYPNPLQHQAVLEYTLKKSNEVTISLLNIFGQTVDVFIEDKIKEAGKHTESLNFNSSHLPGMYFLKINSDNESKLIKCQIY
ncbi:MAG: T9SS type A sorting domain-containing protein [Saprospiraceae bacterium]